MKALSSHEFQHNKHFSKHSLFTMYKSKTCEIIIKVLLFLNTKNMKPIYFCVFRQEF